MITVHAAAQVIRIREPHVTDQAPPIPSYSSTEGGGSHFLSFIPGHERRNFRMSISAALRRSTGIQCSYA